MHKQLHCPRRKIIGKFEACHETSSKKVHPLQLLKHLSLEFPKHVSRDEIVMQFTNSNMKILARIRGMPRNLQYSLQYFSLGYCPHEHLFKGFGLLEIEGLDFAARSLTGLLACLLDIMPDRVSLSASFLSGTESKGSSQKGSILRNVQFLELRFSRFYLETFWRFQTCHRLSYNCR